jgi:ABC-type branched-chain amino acid transport systems, periplasmic component
MSNRRNFLKILGTGFAAATANPIMAGVTRMKSPNKTIKIGVLSPQSNICPQYPYSFMNGFRLGVDQNKAIKKQHIEIVNEPNGYGTPFLSKQNTEKLLFENGVDLMVGILGNEVVGQFESLFTQKQVPFVVCNAGEYYPGKSLRDNPYLFFNTLNLFQSSFASGAYASTQYGKRGFIVSSLYDCGYDSVFAFTRGVENNNGAVEETLVMKMNEADFSDRAISRIKASNPDYVYVLLSGDAARDFIVQYQNSEIKNIPLITTPFLTDTHNRAILGHFAENLESISPWDRNVEIRENKDFYKKYMEAHRSEPDLFAALGYETGKMIYQALALADGNYTGTNIRKSLDSVAMNSIRGEFEVDQKTGWTKTPLYRIKMKYNALNSSTEGEISEIHEPVYVAHEDFTALDNSLRSGWLNPYLFV